jgi:hypothetical protein
MREHRTNDHRRNAAGGRRSSATPLTPATGAQPRERHRIATRLARLENDRARLARELVICERWQRMTATRLAKVNAEIAALRTALLEEGAKRVASRPRAAPRGGQDANARIPDAAPPSRHARTLRDSLRCAAREEPQIRDQE